MPALILLGRVLFAVIFVFSGFNHFSHEAIGYAASSGVPLANVAVPLSGVMAILGGLMIAFGFQARLGGILIALFLIPVTLFMHAFWKISDPMQHQMQLINFMKNLALLGGSFAFIYFGAGPLSVDARHPMGRLADTTA
ncbi:MAG: DoxX family protein [Deltaproteobacteria bacterium]|nr:DoxX family protein [Deltaproteobacteria bacterium]